MRQKELWDQLRELVDPIPGMLRVADEQLAGSGDLVAWPEVLDSTADRLRDLADRIKDKEVGRRLPELSRHLEELREPWKEFSDPGARDNLGKLNWRLWQESLEVVSADYDEDYVRRLEQRRDDCLTRRADLRDLLAQARGEAMHWLTRLNSRDRGRLRA